MIGGFAALALTMSMATGASGAHKTKVCHKGQTISVSLNALDAHEKHGDYAGECDE